MSTIFVGSKVVCIKKIFSLTLLIYTYLSAVDSGGAGGARAAPEFGGSEKGRSLISAYQSLAITTNTPGFKKLSMVLILIVLGDYRDLPQPWTP